MKAFTALMCGLLALLAAALLVPVALGSVRPDDREGELGVGAVVAAEVVHPNDQAGRLGPGAVALESNPAYWQGEADYGLYEPGSDIIVPAVVPTAESPSGWDWNDIVLGIVVVAGLALVAVAVTLTMREHRGPGRPIPH